MSHLPQIALAFNSNQFKEMLSVYFDKENNKDFKQINEMQNMVQELCNRVKERRELINMFLAFKLSQDAFESLKLLKELQEHEMAKTRSLMKVEVLYVCCLASQLKIHAVVTEFLILKTFPFYDKGYDIDLLSVTEDEELMGNLSDEDAVRVCLLLSLEVIFMGRLLVDVVDDSHMRLVENIKERNVFPCGEYIWRHLYDQILNVVSKHKWEHL
nr:phospholipase-like protein [Tanacetum cinerariifolium]